MVMNNKAPVCDSRTVHRDIVEKANKQMLPAPDIKELAGLFKVLGDPTRFRILWALNQAEMCVCDLCATLNMTKSAISHQLNTLRQSKLVKYRREGKNVYYSLDDEHVNQIIEIGLTHIQHD